MEQNTFFDGAHFNGWMFNNVSLAILQLINDASLTVKISDTSHHAAVIGILIVDVR